MGRPWGSGTAAVICAASPLFTLLVARMFGLEQLLLRRVFGMSLGLTFPFNILVGIPLYTLLARALT